MTVSVDRLRELLEYRDGSLYWVGKRQSRKHGDVAGSINHAGYLRVCVDGVRYMAHRIVWALHHGSWPASIIDHVDGNPANNRIENLRQVSPEQNNMNSSVPSHNSSGLIGVSWNAGRQRWVASIKVKRKSIHLGYFGSKDEAADARKSAESKYGFHENHGRSRANTGIKKQISSMPLETVASGKPTRRAI